MEKFSGSYSLKHPNKYIFQHLKIFMEILSYWDIYNRKKEYPLKHSEAISEFVCPIDNTSLILLISRENSVRCVCCGTMYGNSEELTELIIKYISKSQLEKWVQDKERHEKYIKNLQLHETPPDFVDADKKILMTQGVISRLEALLALPNRKKN